MKTTTHGLVRIGYFICWFKINRLKLFKFLIKIFKKREKFYSLSVNLILHWNIIHFFLFY